MSYAPELELADMANLNEQNWKDIETRISSSTSIRWAHFIKNWGIAGAITTACVAVAIFIATQVGGNSRFQGATDEHFKGIDRQLVDLRALVAANHPDRMQNQQAAKQLLAEVKKKLIPPIPAETASQVGQSFADAANHNTGAWGVALDFAAYRSSLNPLDEPPKANFLQSSGTSSYQLGRSPPGKMDPIIKWVGPIVSPAVGAQYDHIGQDQNASLPEVPASLRLYNGATTLDGEQIRNVIMIGVEVHYAGGPVVLSNVAFVDCTFVFDNTDEGRELAHAILTSTKIDFPSA